MAAAIGPVLLTLGGILKILPLLKIALLALNTPMTALIGFAAMLAAAFYSAFTSYQKLQNLNITLGGELTAKGRDLAYILSKENFKVSLLGG